MKIDLNFALKDLNGVDLKEANAGKLVAQSLAASSKGDALKFWDWALKLNKGDKIDLDPSDSKTFREFVEHNEGFTTLAKAQILLALK